MPRRWIGAISVALLLATASAFAHAQSGGEEPWPPRGVLRPGDGVTPPRLAFEVKAQYTERALRARVEGTVVLACVVLPDGSVGPVKVVRSVDRDYGLDQSAVDALKQWRFKPGTKDGHAVPVMVTIEMSFRLSGSPPVLEWPAAFAASRLAEGWTEQELTASALRFQIAFPARWESHASGQPNRVFFVHDPTRSRAFGIWQPHPTAMRLDEPLPPDRLATAVDRLKALVQGPGDILSAGQVRAGGRLWLWVEARLASLDAARALMPPELADRMPWESSRLWIFSTTAGSQFVQVSSLLFYAGGLSTEQIEEQTRQAGADFVAIIERLRITPTPTPTAVK